MKKASFTGNLFQEEMEQTAIEPIRKFAKIAKMMGFEQNHDYEYFPIAPKYRKVVGDGMMRFLLTDKENIRRYLFDDCELGFKVKHDKKGKPIDCEVFIIKDDKEQ